MKMHSPGHSSADSMTASSWPSGISAMPSAPCGLPLAVAKIVVAFLDVGETVVEQREHVGSDLLAETVTSAEILVDPDLHGCRTHPTRPVAWNHGLDGPRICTNRGRACDVPWTPRVAVGKSTYVAASNDVMFCDTRYVPRTARGACVCSDARAENGSDNREELPWQRNHRNRSRRSSPRSSTSGRGWPRHPSGCARSRSGCSRPRASCPRRSPATRSCPTRCVRRATTSPRCARRSTSSPSRRRPTASSSARTRTAPSTSRRAAAR